MRRAGGMGALPWRRLRHACPGCGAAGAATACSAISCRRLEGCEWPMLRLLPMQQHSSRSIHRSFAHRHITGCCRHRLQHLLSLLLRRRWLLRRCCQYGLLLLLLLRWRRRRWRTL